MTGDENPSFIRGLLFILTIISFSILPDTASKSVPLGMYCLIQKKKRISFEK